MLLVNPARFEYSDAFQSQNTASASHKALAHKAMALAHTMRRLQQGQAVLLTKLGPKSQDLD